MGIEPNRGKREGRGRGRPDHTQEAVAEAMREIAEELGKKVNIRLAPPTMVGRGSYMAVTADQLASLLAIEGDAERLDFATGAMAEGVAEEDFCLVDKSWDALDRIFCELPEDIDWDTPSENYGTWPLKLTVLGSRRLLDSDEDGYLRLLTAEQLEELVPALEAVTPQWFLEKYRAHCLGLPEAGQDDLEYAWGHFVELRDWLGRQRGRGRAIVFEGSR